MVHNWKLRVRYGETDQMGRVHHASYIHYLEVARIEMLRELGHSYAGIEADGFLLPVIALSIQYKGVVAFDDILTVETEASINGRIRMDFSYRLWCGEVLVGEASVQLACLSKSTLRPAALPDSLVQSIQTSQIKRL